MISELEAALKGKTTKLLKKTASLEKVPAAQLLKRVARGTAVIPRNNARDLDKPCAIGEGLRTKINANIGTSTDKINLKKELIKLGTAVRLGADAVMDLSEGGDLPAIRKELLKNCPVPFGTVPVYEMAALSDKRCANPLKFSADDMLKVLESQARAGVDFFTIHSGVTLGNIGALKKKRRILPVVSRGGAIIAAWMHLHRRQNPFYEYFDKILDIAYNYDITLSLGDGLRPGSILDATDAAQIGELKTLGELAARARRRNVQVMIEGPGHVPLNDIARNVRLQKKICRGAPFYVLGPLVTDIAAGYDHITGAIGGAIAAANGADFLCYLTPAEHLRHPSVEDVRDGVIASRIAAHAADIAKGVPGAIEADRRMSLARARMDWKAQIALSLDPEKAEKYRKSSVPGISEVCTMCGKYCSIRLVKRCLK
jgi:phosphomethylpyrimidine synthase